MSASSTKEKFQKEMDKQRALEAEISAKESADSPAKQAPNMKLRIMQTWNPNLLVCPSANNKADPV